MFIPFPSCALASINYLENTKIALIFGNEINGIDDNCINVSNEVVEIPQHGTKHSFNVSVSVGIVLWNIIHKI